MLVNTRAFSEEATKFVTQGIYCGDAVGSAPYFEYWAEQLKRCTEGYTVGDTRITGHHYFYLNFCRIKLTEATEQRKAGLKTV